MPWPLFASSFTQKVGLYCISKKKLTDGTQVSLMLLSVSPSACLLIFCTRLIDLGSRKKKGAFYRWVQSPEINKRFSAYFEPGGGIEGELFELYKVQSLEVRPIRYINSGATLSVWE